MSDSSHQSIRDRPDRMLPTVRAWFVECWRLGLSEAGIESLRRRLVDAPDYAGPNVREAGAHLAALEVWRDTRAGAFR